MSPKKDPDIPKDIKVRYLSDGTKIMPTVNGKTVYPEVCDQAGMFAELLRLLATFNPEIFKGDEAHAIKALIHLARHYCDVNGLDYQQIDKQAPIAYSGDRWDAQSKHFGEKS